MRDSAQDGTEAAVVLDEIRRVAVARDRDDQALTPRREERFLGDDPVPDEDAHDVPIKIPLDRGSAMYVLAGT